MAFNSESGEALQISDFGRHIYDECKRLRRWGETRGQDVWFEQRFKGQKQE